MMEQEKQLELYLETIAYSIKLCAFPYLFVISNNEEIRNYFIKAISTLENINILDDSQENSEIELRKKLESGHVLLLNTQTKTQQYEKNGVSNPLYYKLVFIREYLCKIKRTIIIVCDEDTINPLINENQSLASFSSFHFIDDCLKEKRLLKK